MANGTLSIVATPIGNLEDFTLRAIRVLGEVPLIAAEDTRSSRRLLEAHAIDTPLTSYHDFSRSSTVDRLIAHLRSGLDLALISDAGTPGISDPSYRLVNAAIDAGIRVEVLPGATSIVPALVGSGLPTDRFNYVGFIPRKKGRQTMLLELCQMDETAIMLESPHRLLKTLEFLAERIPQRQLTVARELSKIHEEYRRGTVSEHLEYFNREAIRGEFVLVLEGAAMALKRQRRLNNADESH